MGLYNLVRSERVTSLCSYSVEGFIEFAKLIK
jgi:hypothetical protein